MLTWVQILTRDGGTEDLLKVKPRPPPLPVPDAKSPPQIFVPDELIWEILLLLPVKSLIRFKCVCKSWKLIISDHQFVKSHLGRSSANTTNFAHIKLLSETRVYYSKHGYKLHVSHYSVSLLFSPQYPKGHLFHPIATDFDLLGVCNGLVSFTNSIYKSPWACYVCFWNPAIRLWSKMSLPLPLPIQQLPSNSIFGFGYDRVSDTYKVVTGFYYNNDSQVGMQSVVNVYDMRDSCWRSIQSFPHMPCRLYHSSKGVYVNNKLNWMLELNTELFVIVSLDLATEEQLQISLPYFPPDANDEDLLLGSTKDSLCVLHKVDHTRFAIWQMKEFGAHESWIQLFNFDFEEHLNLVSLPFHLNGFILSESHECPKLC
ncbi:F-box/kelch-repeat protein At3g23880-like [Lotus japonicus]|uniref:F-box/kelch-repeat protein At3g23880-like n=1 Tax=Lotus japonicus TaxID=34305 RepID=UPI002584633C|nr:F-box/kelch-repeat protein At3g23880-like [Lotus japonicus]